MNGIRSVSLVLALAGSLAKGVQAQKASCKVNEGGPFQLTSARIYLNKASLAGAKADERPSHLKNSVRVLTENPDKIGNRVGRHMLLGRTLFLWSREAKMSMHPTRGSLGYSSNVGQPQDLLAAIDSSFDVVEAEAPGCADSLRVFRRQIGVNLLNAGISQINTNQLDSATRTIESSLVILPNSPAAYNALIVIAGKKSDTTALAGYSRKVLEAAKGDTTAATRKLRLSAMYNLSIHLIGQASGNSPNKTALLGEARQLLKEYLAEVPGDPNAQQALARVATESGDTTAIAGIYSDMMTNPAKFSDIQLFEAASSMAISKKYDDATKLYEAGLKANPYYRDALFNLTTVYFERKDYARMLPVANRLVQVDPNNPDNWRQLAAAHQGIMRTTKDAKLKKTHQDSLLYYLGKSDSMPVKVSFTEFRHAGSKHILNGMIENRGKTAGNYTLKVEFIDKAGSVVTTEQAVIGVVAPKESKSFSVQTDRTGIVAFRYAPIR